MTEDDKTPRDMIAEIRNARQEMLDAVQKVASTVREIGSGEEANEIRTLVAEAIVRLRALEAEIPPATKAD